MFTPCSPQCHPLALLVVSFASVKSFAAALQSHRLDALILNAGMNIFSLSLSLSVTCLFPSLAKGSGPALVLQWMGWGNSHKRLLCRLVVFYVLVLIHHACDCKIERASEA